MTICQPHNNGKIHTDHPGAVKLKREGGRAAATFRFSLRTILFP